MQVLLETQRLILRRYRNEDAQACFEYLSDRETCYLDGGYQPYSAMDDRYFQLMQQFEQQEGRYMMVLKSENKVIGTIHLMPDKSRVVKTHQIGYVVSPDYRRHGYAFEALSALIETLFRDLGAEMLVASAITRNLPSIRLIKKLGFTKEGNIHNSFRYPGVGPMDMESFYLDKPSPACAESHS